MMSKIEVWLYMLSIISILFFTFIYSLLLLIDNKSNSIIKIIAILIMVFTLYVGINRNTYLPFLGYTVIPPNLFDKEITPSGATDILTLTLNNVPDNTKVIYWAALSSKDKNIIHTDPMLAYGDYNNTGITTVKDNRAILYFHCPDRYIVGPFKKTLNKHVHYRLVKPNNPMISPVYTQYVEC